MACAKPHKPYSIINKTSAIIYKPYTKIDKTTAPVK